MNDELLTITQTASYLQLSDKTVRRLIKAHQLEASKVGDRFWRIRLSHINNYLSAHTNGKKGTE